MKVDVKQQETLERFLRQKRPGLPTIFFTSTVDFY